MARHETEIIVPGNDKDLKWWNKHCPAARRRPGTAKFICFINWATSGPGFTWPACYWISSNRARSHWILWEETDEEVLEGYPEEWTSCAVHVGYDGIGKDTVPIAWCARKDLKIKEAAGLLLQEVWQRLYDDSGGTTERFEELCNCGLLNEKEIYAIAHEVWSTSYWPTGEFYGRLIDPADGQHIDTCRFYVSDNRLIAQAERSDGTVLDLSRLRIEPDGTDRALRLAEDSTGKDWQIVPEDRI